MEEKILIESEGASLKKFKKTIIGIFIAGFIPYFIGAIVGSDSDDAMAVFGAFSLICFLSAPVLLVIYLILKRLKYSITVTNMRVYGITRKRRVDLPLDSISAIGMSSFKGIEVGTSSGKLRFKFIKNQKEIISVLSDLIVARQSEKNNNVPRSENSTTNSNADELKKFKELLDDGIITQEEFDKKKKQLLNL